MGMAASQARWISLAARKTNVEYEGQQINQARTALANQTSELWNKLYHMEVPTPPSTTDFTKTTYTFDIGDSHKVVTDIQDADYTDSDGITYNKYVTYTCDVIEYTGIRNTNSNPQVQWVDPTSDNPDGYYMIGTKIASKLKRNEPDEDEYETYVAALDRIVIDWPESTVAKAWKAHKDDPNNSDIWLFKDTNNEMNFAVKGSASEPDTLDYCIKNQEEALHTYYAVNQTNKKTVSKYAVVEYDASGRATSIQLEKSSAVYELSTTSSTDDDAYNDAMNQYYYNKQVYEKKVQDINAKTEQIQTEDRTLELRLKQLDTEQNALQTEMDAVHKVISKNIENTFKTFND